MHHHLRSEDRLAILQAIDTHRKWYSLDDRRTCVLCNKSITGHHIRITTHAAGKHELHCPTKGCNATSRHWFYHAPSGTAKKLGGYRHVLERELNFVMRQPAVRSG